MNKELLEKIITKHLPKAFIGYGQKGFMCQAHYPELCKIIEDYEHLVVDEACKKQREICAEAYANCDILGNRYSAIFNAPSPKESE